MLPKHPNFQRDEQATSPALSRRRDHMLHGEGAHPREPRLIPSEDDFDPAPQNDPFADDDFDPEIPPPPIAPAALSDDDDIAPPEDGPSWLRLWPVVAGALVLAVLGGATWIVYDAVVADAGGGGDVPYVTADVGPEKIRPREEGGMEVPNQDIRVYNELAGSPAAPEAEVLLPPPEVPLSPPAVAALDPAAIPSVPAPEIEPIAGSGEEPADTETSAAADQPQAPLDDPSVAATEPAAGSEAVQTAAVTGAFRIQLAAVKSRDAAQLGWQKMAKAHPDVLGPLTLDVVQVDRGASGILYRLQAGPFADRGTAEAACGKLKRKSQDCLVVAP